mgnify:CR=1 FL=1
MTSVADLCNLALTRIRFPTPIGDMWEGSRASRIALQVYGQTRDDLFGLKDWPFLRREVSLGAPIKTAPPGGYGVTPWNPATNPPPPWIWEFSYPADCIEIRALRPTPILIPEFTPFFTRFVTAYDTDLSAKVVLTNLSMPLAVITGRVLNPEEWQDSNFTEALVDALAVQFEKHFGDGDVNKIGLAERDAQMSTNAAEQRRG